MTENVELISVFSFNEYYRPSTFHSLNLGFFGLKCCFIKRSEKKLEKGVMEVSITKSCGALRKDVALESAPLTNWVLGPSSEEATKTSVEHSVG